MTTPAPVEPHMIPEVTARGFTRMPPIDGTYEGHEARTYESSAALRPCLWLSATDGERKVHVHLTVENALRLADQIQYLASNHYQLRDDGDDFMKRHVWLADHTCAVKGCPALEGDPGWAWHEDPPAAATETATKDMGS